MRGFYTGSEDNCIEEVKQNSGTLSLIARGDGTEVLLQRIKSGSPFFLEPGDIPDTMEFFYILEGSLTYKTEENEELLGKGEYFYVLDLKSPVHFKALDDLVLLYVSTQPLFKYLSNDIKNLTYLLSQIELKDLYTHSHGKRVRDYSTMIGKKLGLSEARLEKLVFASLFHDIGKASVPDEVLKKPGRLTDDEMDFIKKHPVDGSKMVESTFLEDVGNIIAQHHERLDGSGYPNGLKSDEILLEAKIIGIADSFDAMTSDRPYRKAMSFETAIQELTRLSGIHYDGKLVRIFMEALEENKIPDVID